jgi:hypothetical protein
MLHRLKQLCREVIGMRSAASRWHDAAELLPEWDERTKLIGNLIPPGSQIIELGQAAVSCPSTCRETADTCLPTWWIVTVVPLFWTLIVVHYPAWSHLVLIPRCLEACLSTSTTSSHSWRGLEGIVINALHHMSAAVHVKENRAGKLRFESAEKWDGLILCTRRSCSTCSEGTGSS